LHIPRVDDDPGSGELWLSNPSRSGALEKPRMTAMAVLRGLKMHHFGTLTVEKQQPLGVGEEIIVLLK
jgi:hypothetical protein